ncbi:hypothetical protein PLIIFM63780_010634 [Purpureocillium lilacinum]|nr:hypothetical protein PLIIFM63780_010634 [Purpureocillium lilacinum]
MAIIETFPMLRVDSFQLLERGGQQALRDEQLAAGDALPRELNLALRMNRPDPTMADSHGDIWVQLATAASERPGIFHGTVDEIKEQMRDTLRLSSDTGFPLSRLVAIWRNERWQQMSTLWCETAVGRATFQITT